jgi:hypothetical protein
MQFHLCLPKLSEVTSSNQGCGRPGRVEERKDTAREQSVIVDLVKLSVTFVKIWPLLIVQ